MFEIIENLYLANEKTIRNLELLKENNITAIVNCAKEIPCYYESDNIDYYHIPVIDTEDIEENNKMFRYLEDAYWFIKDYLDKNNKVIVHCKQAIQRSPTVIAAYLMKSYKLSMEEAIKFIKTKRQEAFFYQINFESALHCWELLQSHKN